MGNAEGQERERHRRDATGAACPEESSAEASTSPAPVSQRAPRWRSRSEPLLLPTVENRVAAGAAVLVAVLYFIGCLYHPLRLVVTLPLFAYFGLLALGAWRVRPRRGRGHVFFLWFLPVLLQLCIYLILAWRILLLLHQGHPAPLQVPYVKALSIVAMCLFFGGWIPAIFLAAYCRRGGWLLAAECLGPLVTVLWMVLMAEVVF